MSTITSVFGLLADLFSGLWGVMDQPMGPLPFTWQEWFVTWMLLEIGLGWWQEMRLDRTRVQAPRVPTRKPAPKSWDYPL